jgi:hypothetical protein
MDIGLKATEEALADLLVTDLSAGSSELRKQLPDLLRRAAEQRPPGHGAGRRQRH